MIQYKWKPFYDQRCRLLMKKVKLIIFVVIFFFCSLPTFHAMEMDKGSIVQLRILQTTDLHANMLDYDYNTNKRSVELGLSRTASLILEARKEQENTLLFDVGDAIKGNALADYAASNHFKSLMDMHPVYKSMNLLGYDAATLGNHEFNYGIDFLLRSIKGAYFPFINANIYVDDHNEYSYDDIHFFSPYLILDKEVRNQKGKKKKIKIGIIGLITPITAQWDNIHFKDKLVIKNMEETAKELVPKMKQEGADLIIALVHAGLISDKKLAEKEGNNVIDVSTVDGIDVILYGHSHDVFPKKGEKNNEILNHQIGLINGKPSVQAGFWGNHLGIIDLTLKEDKNSWSIVQSFSYPKSIFRIMNKKKIPIVVPYKPIENVMDKYHHQTLEMMNLKDKSRKK